MKYLLAFAVLLAGCSGPVPPDRPGADPAGSGAAANAAPAPTVGDPRDDGLDGPPETYVARIQGRFQLWQNDRGDDGWMCDVELRGSRTIGGYAIKADEPCLRKIGIEDLSAWFVADSDGFLVLVDATRRPVMWLKRAEEGYFYFGNREFYLSRAAD